MLEGVKLTRGAVLASAFFDREGILCILPPLGMLLAPGESLRAVPRNHRCDLIERTSANDIRRMSAKPPQQRICARLAMELIVTIACIIQVTESMEN